MMIKHILLGAFGFCAGVAVSAGTFAFLLVIGVLPRMMYKANVRDRVMLIENLTVLGVLYGAVKSVFEWNMILPGGHLLAGIFGISAGIFVGGIAAALAEILHTFPIMFRRLHLKEGLTFVMASMAAGKLVGSLFYFLFGYVITAG
jgi:stage V sporulation protein AB